LKEVAKSKKKGKDREWYAEKAYNVDLSSCEAYYFFKKKIK